MKIKRFFKPSILKISIAISTSILYLYFAKETSCGVGFSYVLCYSLYGIPFPYLTTGGIGIASEEIKELFLGKFFQQYGNFLFNPATLVLDLVFIYLLSCILSLLFKGMKPSDIFKKH